MRALITVGVLFLMALSAPFLWLSVAAMRASPLAGGAILFVWFLVMSPFLGALYIVWIRDERPRFLPSDIFAEKRNYLEWSSLDGWPQSPVLFYECGICHQVLPSEPRDQLTCGCGNLFVGPNHIGAQNSSRVMLFEEQDHVHEGRAA